MTMFDLPVDTAEQRKRAHQFRNHLYDLGFERAQYSVYVRVTGGMDGVDRLAEQVLAGVPKEGKVYILWVTDKQIERMIRVENLERRPGIKVPEQLVLL